MSLRSGHDVVYFDKEEEENIKQKFKGYKDGVIKLSPNGWFYTKPFVKRANKYFNFKIQSDDVFVVTYPKCGTTWTLELIWTMVNNPNLDNPEAVVDYNFRTPFLEFDFILDTRNLTNARYHSEEFFKEVVKRCPAKNLQNDNIFFHISDSIPNPRTIKSHLPFSQLPNKMLDTCKVVYVIRHPKDVCSSFYHQHKLFLLHDYIGTFDEFIDFFLNDKIIYSPFWSHLKEAWKNRNHRNLFITFYEKMKQNPIQEFKRLNEFLGTNLSIDQLKKISEYTSFSNMQAKSIVTQSPLEDTFNYTNKEYANIHGGFFRKGKSRSWKNDLTKEQNEKFDKWINFNIKDMDEEFITIFNSL